MPRTAPTSAPIPAAPAAYPTSTPRPMQTRRAASRTPPAPAGSKEDGEAACICRASVPEEGAELVTRRLRQITHFSPQFVLPFLAGSAGGPPTPAPRPRERRQRRDDLGCPAAAHRALRARRAQPPRLSARAGRRA